MGNICDFKQTTSNNRATVVYILWVVGPFNMINSAMFTNETFSNSCVIQVDEQRYPLYTCSRS
jgi:hypothetical protein